MSELFKSTDFATGYRMYCEGKSRHQNPWTHNNRGRDWLAGWKQAYSEDCERAPERLRKYGERR